MDSPRFHAVYNISPILPGHSLIVPKRHVASVLELAEDETAEFLQLARSATRLLLAVFEATGFNWTIQESEPAGQTVEHLHLHIIPRKAGDLPQPGDWYPKLLERQAIDSAQRPRLSEDELRAIVERLRHAADKAISG